MAAKAIDTLFSSAETLLGLTLEYHLKERDEALERRIKGSLQDLALHLNELSSVCDGSPHRLACVSAAGKLRRAVTGRHFDDEHVGPLHEGDPVLQGIAEALVDLKRSLAKFKYSQFPR